MTRISAVAFAAVISGATAQPAVARTAILHYSLGGAVSGPIDLTLDLATGRFSLTDGSRRTGTIALSRGVASAADVGRIGRLADRVTREGMLAAVCRGLPPQPPNADAIRAMTLTLDRRRLVAPDDLVCWNDAAEDLAAAAYAAVRAFAERR